MVAALRGGRLQRHLRLPRLQGAQQNLLHHAPNRQRPAVHHAAGHGQLQREDGEALHRPELHHRRRDHRPRRHRVLPQHAAGECFGQLRHPVGGPAADQARHHRQHRQADRPCARRQAVRPVLQDQQRHRQGHHRQDRRGKPGRRAGHASRARHIVPGPGRARLYRQRPRGLYRGPSARAQPHLRLRPARGHQDLPVQRRPHDAQHGEASRDRLAHPRRGAAQPGARLHRHVPARHGEAARAEGRWNLHQARRVGQTRRAEVRVAGLPHQGGAARPRGRCRGQGRAQRELPQAHERAAPSANGRSRSQGEGSGEGGGCRRRGCP